MTRAEDYFRTFSEKSRMTEKPIKMAAKPQKKQEREKKVELMKIKMQHWITEWRKTQRMRIDGDGMPGLDCWASTAGNTAEMGVRDTEQPSSETSEANEGKDGTELQLEAHALKGSALPNIFEFNF